jgi:protein phosphatase
VTQVPSADEIVVGLARPSLVVLIGAAGSGKTTLAARLFDAGEIISSDGLRAAVSGDPADQRATRPAFAILHREVGRRLVAGQVVVVDATNVERTARHSLLKLAAAAGVPAIALVLALPPLVVHARNAARSHRVVAPDVVDRHLAQMARLLGDGDEAAAEALAAEGFDSVAIARSDEGVERLRVVRG